MSTDPDPPAPRKRPPGPGRGRKVKQGNGAGGAGWGGPAKGPGSSKPARPHGKAGNDLQVNAPLEVKAAMKKKAEQKAASLEEMMDFYVEVKRNEQEFTALRLAAADKWVERNKHLIGQSPRRRVNLAILSLEEKKQLLGMIRNGLLVSDEGAAEVEGDVIEGELVEEGDDGAG